MKVKHVFGNCIGKYLFTPLVMSAMLLGCSEGKLNTQIHEEKDGEWVVENGTVACEKIVWRFISHRELVGDTAEKRRESGMVGVMGTYKFTLENKSKKEIKVKYHLYFFDKNDLEICYYPQYGRVVTLSPDESREISNTFEVTVGNVRVANSIVIMNPSASFTEVDK